jgi:hypothetical protein
MPDPYVTRTELEDGKLVLYVQVDDYKDKNVDVNLEISGEASLENAAFATFRDIRSTGNATYADDHWYLTVAAEPVDAEKFEKGFADGLNLTVAARVSRVWLTVLKKDPAAEAWMADGVASI